MHRILSAIVFLVITLALAGCSRSKPLAADPLRDSRWLLTSFVDSQGQHPVPTDFIPFLEIDAESLSFTSTCNTTYATAHMAGGHIELERTVNRGVGCDEFSQAALDLETAVPESMFSWSIRARLGQSHIQG